MKAPKSKWLKRAGILVGILVAVLLFVWLSGLSEPSYDGRRVSYWFKESCRSGQFNRANDNLNDHEGCVEAFRAMGTNAVPYLVDQAFDFRKESATWSNISRLLNDAPPSWPVPRPISSWNRIGEATAMLQEIKPPASQLLALMQKHLKATNGHEHRQALYVLGASGEGAAQVVPYLTAALKDNDTWSRRLAIQSLGWIGPQAEAAVPDLIELLNEAPDTNYLAANVAVALGKIGSPKAAPAVPAVKKLFEQEKNWNSRGNLGVTLMRLDPTQTEVLNFLMEGVTNHHPAKERWMAANYLGRIGPAARPAVPILIKALEQTNDTLWAEIPKALTNIGVAPGEFLPAMKMRLKKGDRTAQAQSAIQVLRIAPGDHDTLEVLMQVIATGELGPGWEWMAIDSLGDAGPPAAEALPLLRKVAKESDGGMRDKALRAIKKIEAKPDAKK